MQTQATAQTKKSKTPKAPKAPKEPRLDTAFLLRGSETFMAIRLRGDRLFVHQWTQKAVIEMLGKMTGHDMARLDLDLEEEGKNSAYRNVEGADVIPCRVLHKCFTEGATRTRGEVKAHLFSSDVRVVGHTSPLTFEKVDRCDVRMVKVGGWQERTPCPRARTMYYDWSCEVVLRFHEAVISPKKVVSAIVEAGANIGLCEMRLAKGFAYGGFSVEAIEPTPKRLDEIVARCSVLEKAFEIPVQLLRAASAKAPELDRRNPKRKALALAEGLNGAAKRHEEDAAAERGESEAADEE